MIWLYSGTPGSGKSYHAVADIIKKVKRKDKNKVIANFPLTFKNNNHKNNFIYVDNSDMTIDYLENYARENHFIGVEGQTLVVIDEAQILFNSRDWGSNSNKRMAWIKFFSQHRKYGYNFIMIAQFDKMIDRQIRSLIEYEVAHMKINNFFWFLPTTFFLCVERWYGQKMKTGHQIIPYRKKISIAYNSYSTFDDAGLRGTSDEGPTEVSIIKENNQELKEKDINIKHSTKKYSFLTFLKDKSTIKFIAIAVLILIIIYNLPFLE